VSGNWIQETFWNYPGPTSPGVNVIMSAWMASRLNYLMYFNHKRHNSQNVTQWSIFWFNYTNIQSRLWMNVRNIAITIYFIICLHTHTHTYIQITFPTGFTHSSFKKYNVTYFWISFVVQSVNKRFLAFCFLTVLRVMLSV